MAIAVVITALAIARTGDLHAQTPEPVSPEPSSESAPPEAAFDESRAQNIDRMLMCPVCPAQTIAQSQVEIALQMRAIVREMLAAGQDRDGILDFFQERYGKDILAAPPKSGVNLVAWLLPVGGVGAALVAAFFIIRSMTRREPSLATPRPVLDDALAPYLRLVDRHLDLSRGGGSPISNGPPREGTSNQSGPGVEPFGMDTPNPDERR